MRISSIRLSNFRPFYGKHEIDLSPAEGNSFVVVQGENQSGKTALFLALYWCLYGTAKDRHGATLPIFQPGETENDYLFNKRAADEGLLEMRVDIEFTHEGKRWSVTRIATCDGDPLDGGQFTTEALLQIDDAPIVRAEIERSINDVLHRDAAQFYFFDGELLTEYEKWLADPETAQARVREAIERTVGISAFRLGRDVHEVAEEFQEDVNKALRKERRNKDLLDDRDRVSRRKAEVEEEIKGYQDEIASLKAEAERIQQIHGDLAAWREAIARIGALDDKIGEAREKERSAAKQIQDLVQERYWIVLGKRAHATGSEIVRKIEEAFSSTVPAALKSIEQKVCVVCGKEMDYLSLHHARELTAGKGESLSTADDVREAAVQLQHTREFIDASALELLQRLEDDLTAAQIEAETSDEKARLLRRQHVVRGDYEAEMRRLDEIHRQLAMKEQSKKSAEQEIATHLDALNVLDTKIARSGTADPALAKRSRASALAAAAFSGALERFAGRARERVQVGATHAFKALVRDEGYDGIQITEDFVVLPVDAEGSVQTAPSSGGQQLLTLALIAGLNSAAVHDAPIVMDTPFGRLDVGNRERILRWADKLVREQGQQLVLMVHSGELTVEDLKAWRIAPARLYRISPTMVHGHEIHPAAEA